MNQDAMNQRFQQVRDSIESMARQHEIEITSQVASISEDAMKKLRALLESD